MKCDIADEYGNKLHINESGNVSLFLASENRRRNIGTITQDTEGRIYSKSEKSKDIFRKTNSWGLCWAVLQRIREKDSVVIYDDMGRIFKQTKKYITENGSFLFFKQQGFEKRIFLPLEEWERLDNN